jgi:hypothetical protein
VFNNLLAKVCKQYPYWDEMRVAGEGKIIVWSAEKDQLSKTAQAHKMLTQSPQAVLITDQEASHASGLLAPLEAIAPIEKILYETL